MERVSYDREGEVAVVTMDDGKANAIQAAFIEQLDRALEVAEADDEVRALLLRGRPGFFSGGLDLKTLPGLPPEELHETVHDYGRLALRLHGFPKPTVAAATGHALAGGAILLLGCDRRLGARGDFKLGLQEVQIGLPLPTFAVEIARPALTPSARTPCLLFGEVLDPAGALEAGILDDLEDPEDLDAAARTAAEELASLAPEAFAETKRRLKGPGLERGRETLADEVEAFLSRGPFAPG